MGGLLYRFGATGRHISTLDTLTGATLYAFAYDGAGRLSGITDTDGNVTAIERNGDGNPTAIVAPFGQRTALTVDGNGYLASVTNPAGEAYRMQYTADGLLTRFADPRNNASQFAYDGLGRLQNDANAAGGSQTLARTELEDGYTVIRTTALNRTTAYSVEDLSTGDRQRKVLTPDGLETQTLLGTNGSAKVTEPDGAVTDSLGGPDPRFGMQAPITTRSTVTTGGLTATTESTATVAPANPTDPLNFTTLARTTTINGRQSSSVYDKATRTTTITSAAGRQSYSILDANGRVIESGVTDLEPITMSYDARGRLSGLSQGSGAEARTTTFSYNADGYLQSATDALGQSGQLSYDNAGRVTLQTLANGRQIQFGYDAKGNLTSLTPPGQPAHGFTYNAVDLATSYLPPTVPGGGNTGYQYNADKQLTQVTRPDGGVLSYAYDAAGRLSTLTIPAGSYGYSYNAAGQLSGITAPGGIGLAYGYAGSLLDSVTWSGGISGSVEFGYDTDFRINQVTVNGANPIAYQYDADSLLTQAGDLTFTRNAQNGLLAGSALGSVTDSYSYNGFGEPTAYNVNYGTGSLNIAYTRDKLGRITQKVETIGGSAAVTYDYGYDAIGQLIEVKRNGATVASYVYDANGNRLSKTADGTTVNGTYDAQDRMLSYGNATYTYTANGELKTKVQGGQTTTYDYDALGNLRGVTLPGGTQIEYLIDGQNRRVGKKVNGALVQGFLYQSQLQPVAELDGSGAIVSRFVYGKGINVPDYLIKGGATYRIVTDHLGSPRLVVNTTTGAIAQQMDYDEYGNVLTTNPGFQPFGFAGGIYDRDTGLVRFGARDYEAESGRWLVKDQILFEGNSTNLFAYSRNDPINWVDPTGKLIPLIPLVVASGVGGGLTNVYVNWKPGQSVGDTISSFGQGFGLGIAGGFAVASGGWAGGLVGIGEAAGGTIAGAGFNLWVNYKPGCKYPWEWFLWAASGIAGGAGGALPGREGLVGGHCLGAWFQALALAGASQVGYALRTFFGVWTLAGTRCVPYGCGETMVRGAYPTGEHGELPAVLCAGRVILFHRGDGTAGGDFGKRFGAGLLACGVSGLSATLAVSGGCLGDAARSPARHLDLAAGRCRLFQTLGCDQKTLYPILAGGGRQ